MSSDLERLRAALAWYADPDTYDAIGPLGTVKGTAWKLREDMGQRARDALTAAGSPREAHSGALWENWPEASCCGEPRVCRDVDACYDCAKPCGACGEPSVGGMCPTHFLEPIAAERPKKGAK